MTEQTAVDNLFPGEQDIPDSYRIPEPMEQREYLIDGALLTWQGDQQPIRSPAASAATAQPNRSTSAAPR